MSFEFLIEHGKVREFAAATLTAEPAYHAGLAVPPTFLSVAGGFWTPSNGETDSGVGLDITRVLHAEEEFVVHGPPPMAGERLLVNSIVGEPIEKTGGRGGRLRFVTITTEFRDTAGSLIAEQRSTLVENERAPGAGA